MLSKLSSAKIIGFDELKVNTDNNIILEYNNIKEFENIAKYFGVMSDEKV